MSVREEDGKVYVNKDEYNIRLRYLTLNDEPYPLTIQDDEYILYDFNIEDENTIPEVGNKWDLIFPLPYIQRMDWYDLIIRHWNLNLFYRDGHLEYKSPDFYPDPFFPDELADGIKEITNLPKNEGGIYNLQGQRISHAQKGLNIIDGRKVWVR